MNEQAELSPSPEPAEAPSGPASRPRLAHAAVVLGVSVFLVWLTRWPLLPPQLYSFDNVNLALALRDFDPTRNQPQPPGYPLFVLEARALLPLLRSPERVFAVLQIVISGLSMTVLYLLGETLFAASIGTLAAALLLFYPAFWLSGLTSPLRPHLALFSALVAYYCWRAAAGEKSAFYAASIALAIGGGFRPELCVTLLPLWLWAAWRCGSGSAFWRGTLLLALLTCAWVAYLIAACGGLHPMITSFREYLSAQTFQSSGLWGAPDSGWRRMAGRAALWTALGALPWLWALPFGWRRLRQSLQGSRVLLFLCVWFLPGMVFHVMVHSGAPDHFLDSIPVVCLVGGLSLSAVEQALGNRVTAVLQRIPAAAWLFLFAALFFLFVGGNFVASEMAIGAAVVLSLLPLTRFGFGVRGPLVAAVLLANVLLFTGRFSFPQGPAGGQFRGLASLGDAFLGATYEDSYNHVRWVSDRMAFAAEQIPRLRSGARGPLVLIWSRDGEPVWRKLSYYFPSDKLYVLDEAGDPGVPSSQARLWSGNSVLRTFSGDAPIRLPVPRDSRLVWFVAGGQLEPLAQTVRARKISALAYSDLPPDTPAFRWGSFEFAPE